MCLSYAGDFAISLLRKMAQSCVAMALINLSTTRMEQSCLNKSFGGGQE